MEVVYRSHTSDEGDMECFVVKAGHKFWFSAGDIAVFLGCKDLNNACLNVRPETWKKWGKFNPSIFEKEQAPSYWNSDTALISEVSLLGLLCKSTEPKAREFERWMFDDVLPTLREAGQYKLEKSFHEQLAIKDRELIKLRDKVLELCGKAVEKVFE